MDRRTSVFVSYSRKDTDFALQLVEVLSKAGFAPSIDTRDIVAGEAWRERLASLIEASDEMVFVVSPDSITSEICEWEITHAEKLGKRILPVICRDVETAAIPVRLQRLQFTFFTPGSDATDALEKLMVALREDTAWVRRHTVLVARAQHWDASGRASHAILRGQDLAEAEDLVLRRPPKPATPEIPVVVQEFIASSRETERKERDHLRRTLGLAYSEPVKTAYRAGEHETAIKLATWGALQAQDVTFSLVPELWDAVAPAIVASPTRARFHGHTDHITTSAARPEHSVLATGAKDRQVWIWHLASRSARCRFEHPGVVTTVALSPDATLGASASTAGDLAIWRTSDGALVQKLPALGGVTTELAWSPDGRSLAVGLVVGEAALDGSDDLLSIGEGRARLLILDPTHATVLHSSGELPAPISAISFDPASTRLLIGLWCGPVAQSGAALVFSLSPLKEMKQLDVYGHNIKDLMFSCDGRFIFSNSERGDYFQSEHAEIRHMRYSTDSSDVTRSWIQCWDANSGKKRIEFIGHADVVHCMSLSSDSRRLVTGSADGTARIWDAETGNELHRLSVQGQDVFCTAFSGDNRRVAMKCADDAVRVWSAETGALLRELTNQYNDRAWLGQSHKVARAQALVFCDSDYALCDIGTLKTPRIIDTAKSRLIAEHWNHNGPVAKALFTPQGERIIAFGGDSELICLDHTSGSCVARAVTAHPRLAFREDSLTFFAGGRFVAAISEDFRYDRSPAAVVCVDLSDGTTVFRAYCDDGGASQILVLHTPPGIVVPGKEGPLSWCPSPHDGDALLKLWSVHQSKEPPAWLPGKRIVTVADGRVVVSVGKEREFTFNSSADGSTIVKFPSLFTKLNGHYQHYSSIEERGTGLVVDLIEYNERKVIIQRVDLKSGSRAVYEIERTTEQSGDLNWTQDNAGRLALSIVGRGRSGLPSVHVCDATKGALLMELPHPKNVADAHFHPTLPYVVTACYDGGVRVWDVSRADVAVGQGATALIAAIDHGIGHMSASERAHLLLRDAPDDVFVTYCQALPKQALVDARAIKSPLAHPACYAPSVAEQSAAEAWSPFIEHLRRQALPDPSFDNRTLGADPRAFRHTTVFRLADELTKSALRRHLSTPGLTAAAGDVDRLTLIDDILNKAVGLATDLHHYVRPFGEIKETEHGYRDLLAYDREFMSRGSKGILDDSAKIDFDRVGLEDLARRYLQCPFRCEEFEVTLVRALTGLEMYQYAKALHWNETDRSKVTQAIIVCAVGILMLAAIGLIGFGIRSAVLHASASSWIGAGTEPLADLLSGAFALLALQTLWGTIKTLFSKPSGFAILRKMSNAYVEIPERAPLSPSRLRNLLQESARLGAVWPAALYGLLDDMERRVIARPDAPL